MITPDVNLFRLINSLAERNGWVDAAMIFSAQYLVFIIAALAVLPWLTCRWWRLLGKTPRPNCDRPWRMALAATLAAIFAVAGNWLFSRLFFRHRPFAVLQGVHELIAPPLAGHSFPSSHAAVAFAVAFAVLFSHRFYGLALLVLAGVVAFARVFVGVHYPLDVLAGVFAGLFWAALITKLDGASRWPVRRGPQKNAT